MPLPGVAKLTFRRGTTAYSQHLYVNGRKTKSRVIISIDNIFDVYVDDKIITGTIYNGFAVHEERITFDNMIDAKRHCVEQYALKHLPPLTDD